MPPKTMHFTDVELKPTEKPSGLTIQNNDSKQDGFSAQVAHHRGGRAYQEDAWSLHRICDDDIASLTKQELKKLIEIVSTDMYAEIADQKRKFWTQGSTMSFVILTRGLRMVVNLGDSGADLDVGKGMQRWVQPHTVADEKNHIEKNGVRVIFGRVGGVLGVGRAFGDNIFHKCMNPTRTCSITTWDNCNDERVILYSDGNVARDKPNKLYDRDTTDNALETEFCVSYDRQDEADNFTSMHLTRPKEDNLLVCAGVYDGHGGAGVSRLLAEKFPKRIMEALRVILKAKKKLNDIAETTDDDTTESDSEHGDECKRGADSHSTAEQASPTLQHTLLSDEQRVQILNILKNYRSNEIRSLDEPAGCSCSSFFRTAVRSAKLNIMKKLLDKINKKDISVSKAAQYIRVAFNMCDKYKHGKLDRILQDATDLVEKFPLYESDSRVLAETRRLEAA